MLRIAVAILLALLLLPACSSEPQIVEVTRVVTLDVAPEQVEVTRLVEITATPKPTLPIVTVVYTITLPTPTPAPTGGSRASFA